MSFKSGPECQQAGLSESSDTRVASGEAKLWREHTGMGRGKLPLPVCGMYQAHCWQSSSGDANPLPSEMLWSSFTGDEDKT